MFTEEIDGMLKDNHVQVLKLLSQLNPEQFKQNVQSLSTEGLSLFNSFYPKNYGQKYVLDLLELCQQYGYSLMDSKKEYDNNFNIKNKNNPKLIPEVIVALSNSRHDDSINVIVEKIGKENILKLEQEGWPILECCYRKGFVKTIQVLSDFGCNTEVSPSGNKLLQIAENNQKTVDLYWAIKNKKESLQTNFMTDEQFGHFHKVFVDKCKHIHNKKDGHTESILNWVIQKKEVLNKEQKEKLLIESMGAVDLRLFKGILKLLNIKQNSKELKDLIFPELERIKHHELLYPFLEDKEYLFKLVKKGFTTETVNDKYIVYVSPEKNQYGINLINDVLCSLDINPFEKYNARGNKGLVSQAVSTRLKNLFEDEHLLLEMLDNGQTLFENIINQKEYRNKLFGLINIVPKSEEEKSLFKKITPQQVIDFTKNNFDFNEEQKQEIREVLDKTFLKLTEENKPLILSNGEKLFNSSFWLLDYRLFKDDSIFTLSEKEKVLELLVGQNANSWSKTLFNSVNSWDKSFNTAGKSSENNSILVMKAIYLDLRNNKNTNWNNITIGEHDKEYLKDSEFLFELNALQFSQQLNGTLKEKDNIKKVKMKI
jgi:hypothetical protein